MGMHSWTIVQFVEDSTVEAVPSNWLVGGYCYWPSLLSHNQVSTAIKKCEPMKKTWKAHKIKLFSNGTFDNYAKARSKAKVAEETSDLQSEVEKTTIRTKKNKERPLTSDRDESDSILPAPPVLQSYKKSVASMKSNENVIEKEPVENIPIDNNDGIIENQETTAVTEAYLKKIIEQQHLLRIILTDVLTKVERIEKQLETKLNSSAEKTSIFQGNILFPINVKEELQKLEIHLQDENHFRDTVHELAKIGGANNLKFVKRVMGCLITNELAMQYSWFGKKGKKKFYNLKVAKVVIDAAEKSKLAKDRNETEVSIQSWLRRATERNKVIVKDV